MLNPYVFDKLNEFDREHSSRSTRRAEAAMLRAPRRPLGPVARSAGRLLRRTGVALESWAAPAAECEPLRRTG